MDLATLKTTLASWGVQPPDIPRAGLYYAELKATRDLFWTGLATDPNIGGGSYLRYRTALRDPKLLNSFCALMDEFISAAVAADFATVNRPYPKYQTYLEDAIFDANEDNYNAKVRTYFETYPVAGRAMAALANSFRVNIQKACTRVQKDWAAVERTFALFDMERLIEIKATGSDFHKGGQQVLILTFEQTIIMGLLGPSSPHPLYPRFQVVYKPADLEVDCLIAGNSAAVNAVTPGFQAKSLFEILNDLIAAEKGTRPALQPFPTYRILPYGAGSTLRPDGDGKLSIADSYGYLEFVRHEHAPGTSIWNYYPFGSSDFKIFAARDADAIKVATPFYQLMGQLAAVASTFSFVDMHMENVIVSKYVPVPIDLEVGLTSVVTRVADTLLVGGIAGTIDVLAIADSGKVSWEVDKARDGRPQVLITQPVMTERQNRLYRMRPERVVDPKQPGPVNWMLNGITDGIAILKKGVAANSFATWLARVRNGGNGVVVRYLPTATGDFNGAKMQTYWNENTATNADFYKTTQRVLLTNVRADCIARNIPDPKYLALQPAYTDTDLSVCDTPSFYHRIGTTGIMSSSGVPVAIPATVVIDGDAGPVAVAVQLPNNRTTFFATSPFDTNVVAGQLNILGTDAAPARELALRQTLVSGLGLDAVPDNLQVIN